MEQVHGDIIWIKLVYSPDNSNVAGIVPSICVSWATC